jgi:hypothetical protein
MLPKSKRGRSNMDSSDFAVRPVSVDVAELKGLLKRPRRRRPISVDEMNEAIVRQQAKKQ